MYRGRLFFEVRGCGSVVRYMGGDLSDRSRRWIARRYITANRAPPTPIVYPYLEDKRASEREAVGQECRRVPSIVDSLPGNVSSFLPSSIDPNDANHSCGKREQKAAADRALICIVGQCFRSASRKVCRIGALICQQANEPTDRPTESCLLTDLSEQRLGKRA